GERERRDGAPLVAEVVGHAVERDSFECRARVGAVNCRRQRPVRRRLNRRVDALIIRGRSKPSGGGTMAKIVAARGWCNNEVAYLAWKADGKIDGCLGFMITRIHVDTHERRILPTWVAFKTQSNPDWEEQDTSVWPVQKFSWRDLTLRRSRNTVAVRPPSFTVRYEIVPVGLKAPGRQPVPPSATAPVTDEHGKKRYKGTPIPLFFCGAPVQTKNIVVTMQHGDVSVAFTNGILSTQNLRKQLQTPKGTAPSLGAVKQHIERQT